MFYSLILVYYLPFENDALVVAFGQVFSDPIKFLTGTRPQMICATGKLVFVGLELLLSCFKGSKAKNTHFRLSNLQKCLKQKTVLTLRSLEIQMPPRFIHNIPYTITIASETFATVQRIITFEVTVRFENVEVSESELEFDCMKCKILQIMH